MWIGDIEVSVERKKMSGQELSLKQLLHPHNLHVKISKEMNDEANWQNTMVFAFISKSVP